MEEKKKNPFFNTISIKGWKTDAKKVQDSLHKEVEKEILDPRAKANRPINRGRRGQTNN